MLDSVLNTIKKLLGISAEDTAFDTDIIVLINTAIATLAQVGVGPATPVVVVDKDTEWSALSTDPVLLSLCTSYIFMSVKISFDPPGTSFALESYKQVMSELIWRIQVEADPYVPPVV